MTDEHARSIEQAPAPGDQSSDREPGRVVEPYVYEGEVIGAEQEPMRTVQRSFPQATGLAEQPRAGRSRTPLAPEDAGTLRYVASVAGHGVLKTPIAIWDRYWDHRNVAEFREGGTHRGQVLERHQQAYVNHQRLRARRRAAVARAVTTPWHTRARIGQVPVPVITWAASAAEAADVVYPANPVLAHTIGLFNSWLGDLVAGMGDVAAPIALPAAVVGAAAAVGHSVSREHRRRRHQRRIREGQEVHLREAGEILPALTLDEVAGREGVMEAVRRALAIEKILVKPLGADGTEWGWEVTVQLKKGAPGDIAGKTAELETLLDLPENGFLVQTHRDRRAQVTLRLVESDPWADLPTPPEYAGASRSVTDPIWLGQRLDSQPIASSFAGKQSIVLAASGGGKSILLRLIVDGLAACDDVVLWDLDPSGVGQAPQARVMGKTALSPDDCQTALAQALAIAEARTRMLRSLGMGDAWKPSPQRPALVLILDEFPRLTNAGKQLAIALLRVARKAGLVLIFASQDPKKNTLGDSIAGQVAFKAGGPGLIDWQADQLFGPGCKAHGWDPGRYQPATSQDQVNDAGVFFFSGTGTPGGDTPLPSKTGYLSATAAKSRADKYRNPRELDADTLTRAELTTAEVNTHTDADQAAAAAASEGQPTGPGRISAEARQLLTAAAEVYAEVEDTWIPTKAIVEEVAVGELGWDGGRAGEMRVAKLLAEAGVVKDRKPIGHGGEKVSAWARAGLLLAANPQDDDTDDMAA